MDDKDIIAYELDMKVILKQDIKNYKDFPKIISNAIYHSMCLDQNLRELHSKKGLKQYCISWLNTLDGVITANMSYDKGNIYSIIISSLNKELLEQMLECLFINENDIFKVIDGDISEIGNKNIISIYTQTPCVVTNGKKRVVICEKNIEFFKDRILKNTNRKYNDFFNANEELYDFIEKIVITQKHVSVFNYNDGKILANKLRIYIKKDKKSQELATIILGLGLLENNSLGFGKCIAALGCELL